MRKSYIAYTAIRKNRVGYVEDLTALGLISLSGDGWVRCENLT